MNLLNNLLILKRPHWFQWDDSWSAQRKGGGIWPSPREVWEVFKLVGKNPLQDTAKIENR